MSRRTATDEGQGELFGVPVSRGTDRALFRDGTSTAGHTGGADANRLASGDRADHPHADVQGCKIPRVHQAHPYGRIHETGEGLVYWCEGRL